MIEDVYPLSPLQEGMYYHWLVSPESWMNFEQISYRIKGDLNIALMEESYAALVSRHGALRTFFTQEFGDEALQVVAKTTIPGFKYLDVSSNGSLAVEKFKEADRITGFNLHTGSQMRLAILETGNNTYEFIWSFHHIIMDAWCIGILIQDFFTIYYSLLAAKTPVLGTVYPYSNYIKWLGNIDKGKSLDYWKEYLSGYNTTSSLPKKPPVDKPAHQPGEIIFTLEKDRSQSIKVLCGETGITENSFIQAVWGILLSRYSNTKEVVFGSIVSGRPGELKGIEKMVGLFINTIPVRVRIGQEMSVRELFKTVQHDFIKGTDHHYVQLAEIQAASEPGRNLFDHILLFENYLVEDIVEQHTERNSALSLLSVSMFDQNNYGLTVAIFPGDKLRIKFFYNKSIYEETLLERLKEQLMLAIEQVLENPDMPIGELSFLSPAEKQQQDKTVVSLFREAAGAYPGNIALIFQENKLTYKELNEQSDQFSAYLSAKYEIRHGDLVAVCLDRSEWLIVAILGILKAGAAYLPLDTADEQDRIDLLLTDSSCKTIIDEAVLTAFRKEQKLYTVNSMELVNEPGDCAYTTAGVMITHAALLNTVIFQQGYFNINAGASSLQFASPAAESFAWEIFLSLVAGGTLCIILEAFKNNPLLLEDYISENRINVALLPAMYAGALRTEKLQSVKKLITYGENPARSNDPLKNTAHSKEYVAPTNEVEEQLAAIWQSLLGKQQISIKDKFFELGGQSITATKLVAQIQKVLGVKIALKELFTHTVLEDLAALIQQTAKKPVIDIVSVSTQDSYPLSSAQRRLWVLSQFEGGNIAYNMPGAYIFEGTLDLSALTDAFNTLITRHEILRTVFKADGHGEVRQVIQPAENTGFKLFFRDMRNEQQQEEVVNELVRAEFLRPFDLAGGPLLRAGLLQVSDNKWVFTYTMHHIITDAWSMGVLIRELLQLYNACTIGVANPLPPLRIQYKDYAAWQKEQLNNIDAAGEHETYWLQQMNGELPVLELQGDKVRPAVKTYNGASVSKRIDAKKSKALRALSQEQNGTLFMGLLSLVYTLLYRYTGQEDIILGSPIAGREHIDLDDQIGFYVNTIALRARVTGKNSFKELLAHIREVTLDAYEHQMYPFDELVDKLNLQRDVSRNPLFDVQVFLQNTETLDRARQQNLGDLKVKGYEGTGKKTSVFDLVFNFIEVGEEIYTAIDYNTDIYTNHFIEQIADHLVHLLNAVITYPAKPVAQLDYLIPQEKELLLAAFNNTAATYPKDKTVVTLFREQAAKTPDHTAVVFGEIKLSYKEVDEKSDLLANYLRQNHNIQPDNLVGILLDKSEWMIIAILGILKSGGAYVPIDPEYPWERKKFILEDTGVKILLTQSDYIFDLEYCEAPIFALDFQFATIDPAVRSDAAVIATNDLAYVIYTSGSTGTPKGVMVEHRSLTNLCYWHTASFSVTEKDHATLYAGVAFDAAVWEFFPYIITGACLYIIPREIRLDVESLSDYYQVNNITVSFLPTQIGERFMEVANHSLRYLLVGGDKLNTFVKMEYQVVNNYGPTEATVVAASYPVNNHVENIPVGKPISNTYIYILNDQLGLCPVGVAGEICIGGDGLARGYLNQPALTAEKFVADPFKAGGRLYKTGDLGRWLPDGNIEFTGRKDDQVKIRGYRIESGEIESVLNGHAMIDSAVVIARHNRASEKELIAYLVSSETLDFAEIRHYLGTTLPSYMIPARFIQVAALPLNASGKVDKKRLPDPYVEEQTAEDYVAPENENELLLSGVWKEVLGLEKIGVNENFFSIGGNSISAIGIQTKARSGGLELTMQQMFETPTIAGLAKVAVKSKRNRMIREDASGTMELLPIQHWYFDNQTNDRHYFNYTTMLVTPEAFSEVACKEVISTLYKRHDALRLRFQIDGDVRQAVHEPLSDKWINNTLDVCPCEEMDGAAQLNFVNAYAAAAQAGFSIFEGPLLKMVWFDYGSGNKGRLLLIIHHLLVDGVSWRILLEDINLLLTQVAQQQPLVLALKTDSYQRWSEALKKYANSRELMQQHSYWQSVLQSSSESFPREKEPQERIVKEQQRIEVELDELSTQQLVHQSPKTYNTQINDLLLTALLDAISRWGNMESCLINLEGHGRVNLFDDVEVSQTVGWFTSLFPVFLDKEGIDFNTAAGIAQGIKRVKENLRSVPDSGIGYGILRYLSKDAAIIQTEKEHKAAVLFNYLGDFKSISNDLAADRIRERTGPGISANQKTFYALEFNGAIIGGRLKFAISYHQGEYSPDTIAQLGAAFKQALQTLITHTLAVKSRHYTRSDFPLASLTQETVEDIEKDFPALQDVYPATAMQKGIFFYASVADQTGGYVNQQHGVLRNIDQHIFRRSWQELVDRHSILRTSFRICEINGLLQVVSSNAELPYYYIDLRAVAQIPQTVKIQELVREDAAADFDFEQAPMLRITMVHLREHTFYLILTFHHIVLDGWSIAILFAEFNQIYNAHMNKIILKLPAVLDYGEYIKWLSKQDPASAQEFWSGELKAVSKTTKLADVNPVIPESKVNTGYNEISTELTIDSSNALKKQAAHYEITLNTLLMAAWGLLLSNYTNEEEVIFGMTISGRGIGLDGIESMVGLFINSIPVKVNCKEDLKLGKWLKSIQKYQVEMDRHNFLGLAEIHRNSALEKDQALFESLFVHENYPVDIAGKNGRKDSVIDFASAGIKDENNFPITLQIISNKNISFTIRYKTEIFDNLFVNNVLSTLTDIVLWLSHAKEDHAIKDFTLKSKRNNITLPKYEN